ncbi:MAG TPA: alpha-E domain-containing protein [Methylomirabilota bacterium]|jgi:uncharacterized alpha-E superfamily protein|nr:alpha-E domain-containing protein [Methylomirabilota bacterium]
MLSRVAAALYWMGRYLERAENVTRLLMTTEDLSTEIRGFNSKLALDEWRGLDAVFPGAQVEEGRRAALDAVALGRLSSFFGRQSNTYSIAFSLRKARENARTVREALSVEVFVTLNDAYRDLEHQAARDFRDLPAARAALGSTQKALLSVSGAIEHTLSRDQGWSFLKLGEALERVYRTATLLRVKLPALLSASPERDIPLHFAQWRGLLKSLSSLENYRKVHGGRMEPDTIVQFLVFDPHAPRSLRFGAGSVKACLEAAGSGEAPSPPARVIGRLDSQLRYAEVTARAGEKAMTAFLDSVLTDLSTTHDALDAFYFET